MRTLIQIIAKLFRVQFHILTVCNMRQFIKLEKQYFNFNTNKSLLEYSSIKLLL